jgi:TolA-binding protein
VAAAAASLLLTVAIWQMRRIATPPATVTVTSVRSPAQTGAPVIATPAPPAIPIPTTTSEPVHAADVIVQMAAVVPPRFELLPMRSEEEPDAAAFRAAMTHYNAGRYDEAVRALRSLTERSPALGHAQFFLGIAELMRNNPPVARTALKAAAASAEQPYADESHFYLAKAALRAGNPADAERELKITISREAGPSGEATRLLKELRSLPR